MKYILGTILFIACIPINCIAQKLSVNSNIEPNTIWSIPSPNIVHGAGFAKLSNYNAERSFKEARQNAIIDLEASLLTSVYLEFYGTDAKSRLKAEFSISDTINASQIAVIDSTIVEDWAVYFIRDNKDTIHFPSEIIEQALSTNWNNELYEPRNIAGFWISSGMSKETPFNPDRGWTLAKQHALQNLSEYLKTRVQSLERTYDDTLSSVHYVTSKHIFNSIGVIGRKKLEDTYYVMVIVHGKDIIGLDEETK